MLLADFDQIGPMLAQVLLELPKLGQSLTQHVRVMVETCLSLAQIGQMTGEFGRFVGRNLVIVGQSLASVAQIWSGWAKHRTNLAKCAPRNQFVDRVVGFYFWTQPRCATCLLGSIRCRGVDPGSSMGPSGVDLRSV